MFRRQMEALAAAVTSNAPSRLGRPKTVRLNIASNYAPEWTVACGFRELLSNAVDGAHSLAKRLAIQLRVRTVQFTDTFREIQFYICRCGDANRDAACNSNDDDHCLVVASIVGQQHADGRCVLVLTNYYTRLDHNKVLVMGGTTKASQVASSTVIGKNGEGLKVGALAILRGDADMYDGGVVYCTAGNRWEFLVQRGRAMVEVRSFVRSAPPREHDDVVANPLLHTTVIVRCRSNSSVSALERLLPRDLYAPLLLPAASLSAAAPLLLFSESGGVPGNRGDIINSDAFIHFRPDVNNDDDSSGSLFVANILVTRNNRALPFVHYCDALLKTTLSRDRNHVRAEQLGALFAKRIAKAIEEETLDERSAAALFCIVAERLQDIDHKEDAGAAKLVTAWDYLIKHAVCCKWFADEFRKRYPHSYPCASDSEERVVRERLCLTPCRVSRCLFRILTTDPRVSGFWPVERAAEAYLLSAPTVVTDPAACVAPVAALVNKCLSLCGSARQVCRVVMHTSQVSAFVLDEQQVLHCPSSLFRQEMTRVSVLAKAFGAVLRMPQIASSMPESFYEVILPLVAGGGDIESASESASESENDIEKAEPDKAMGVKEKSLKRLCTVDGQREKKRLRGRFGGDEEVEEEEEAEVEEEEEEENKASAPLLLPKPLCSIPLPQFPARLERLPIAQDKRGADDDSVCSTTALALTRVSPPPSMSVVAIANCSFYIEEDGGADMSLIDWPAMFWCAHLVRALLTHVFGYPQRKFVVVWAPMASYKAQNRGAERLLVFNAALLRPTAQNDHVFYETFIVVCHELTHDSRGGHDSSFVAAFQHRLVVALSRWR